MNRRRLWRGSGPATSTRPRSSPALPRRPTCCARRPSVRWRRSCPWRRSTRAIALANATRLRARGQRLHARSRDGWSAACARSRRAPCGSTTRSPTTTPGPFGGLQAVGAWGRELGQEGLEAFQETKHVSHRDEDRREVPGGIPTGPPRDPSPPQRRDQDPATRPTPAATLERALALGASDEGVLAQRDTYFGRAPRGRLKLARRIGAHPPRAANRAARLIAYVRPDGEEAAHEQLTAWPRSMTPRRWAERARRPPSARSSWSTSAGRPAALTRTSASTIDDVAGARIVRRARGASRTPTRTSAREARARGRALRDELALGEPVAGSYSDLLLDSRGNSLAGPPAGRRSWRNAYAPPYSNFPVGAALRSAVWGDPRGARNVENAAYPPGPSALKHRPSGRWWPAGDPRHQRRRRGGREARHLCPAVAGGCRQRPEGVRPRPRHARLPRAAPAARCRRPPWPSCCRWPSTRRHWHERRRCCRRSCASHGAPRVGHRARLGAWARWPTPSRDCGLRRLRRAARLPAPDRARPRRPRSARPG